MDEEERKECGKDCICCKKMYRVSWYIFTIIISLFMGFLIAMLGFTIYDLFNDDFSPNQKMAEMCYECLGDTNITAVSHCYLGTQVNSGYRISTMIQCSLKKVFKEVTGNSSPE